MQSSLAVELVHVCARSRNSYQTVLSVHCFCTSRTELARKDSWSLTWILRRVKNSCTALISSLAHSGRPFGALHDSSFASLLDLLLAEVAAVGVAQDGTTGNPVCIQIRAPTEADLECMPKASSGACRGDDGPWYA